MPTVNDKFIELAPLWSGTIGSGGVPDGSTTTIPLASTNGLVDGNVYVLTIDRIDANGTKTPSKREVVIGKVSGNNLINCLRGVEGTAQAHSAGAVVELLFTAKQWNRLIEGVRQEHNDDGTHKVSISLTTPRITTSINDANGNEIIKTPATASAVNEITITNSATGNPVAIDATGDDANVNLLIRSKGSGIVISPLSLAEGQMINGKIMPSVSSGNLTVALKTMDGSDPSSSNPVYVRIGDAVRSVTSAKSVTLNAGTNWFNAGSSELATKEIDYFVYLGYNSTNGVVIGFARIPYGCRYDDFSTTNTNEKYLANISNLVSGDAVCVVGRFAAILSAGSGYTWSVPTFTASNLIQRPIFHTRRLTYTPTINGTSGSAGSFAYTSYGSTYMINGNEVLIDAFVRITDKGSWGGAVQVSLPLSSNNVPAFISLAGFIAQMGLATTSYYGVPVINTYHNTNTIIFERSFGTANVLWADITPNIDIRASGRYFNQSAV